VKLRWKKERVEDSRRIGHKIGEINRIGFKEKRTLQIETVNSRGEKVWVDVPEVYDAADSGEQPFRRVVR
jgi:hypothetical protein